MDYYKFDWDNDVYLPILLIMIDYKYVLLSTETVYTE